MPTYLPADEISHKLFVATNLAACLYIACTEPSWLFGTTIVAFANIIPMIEAIATGVARRRILDHNSWSDSTIVQWSQQSNSGTFFSYPTISPECMSRETAETILNITKPFNN